MVALLLPFWKKFCFVLSARTSSNNLLMIQTMSGNSISIESFEETTVAKEDSSEEKHFEKLGQIVQGRCKSNSSILFQFLKLSLETENEKYRNMPYDRPKSVIFFYLFLFIRDIFERILIFIHYSSCIYNVTFS